VRGLLALPLGVVLSFVFDFAAEIMFRIGVSIAAEAGRKTFRNPAFWVARGLAWMVLEPQEAWFTESSGNPRRKHFTGAGGNHRSWLGGMLFDPIVMISKGGAPSRAVGFALLGVATE